ncbi:hypothetical protein [Leisingera sp.]|uniref:hypothetical protein n=1 Tax=Leisingera sp. TaxID=1879318 RepID=UPI003A8EBC50
MTFAAVLAVTGFRPSRSSPPWAPVSSAHWIAITAAAVFVLMNYFSVQTMQVGDVSFIAPFRYTGLIWALFSGGWCSATGRCRQHSLGHLSSLRRGCSHSTERITTARCRRFNPWQTRRTVSMSMAKRSEQDLFLGAEWG